MPPSNYSAGQGLYIAEAFQEYLKTGNSQLIENFTEKELRSAISQLSPYYNTNKTWYREIENRIEQLSRVHTPRQKKFEFKTTQWFDRVIFFVFGVSLGLLL